MRRSLAPSQLLKRKQGCLEEEEPGNRRKQKFKLGATQDEDDNTDFTRRVLAPLPTQENHGSSNFSAHEVLIRKILSKPFKVPIPNYQGKIS